MEAECLEMYLTLVINLNNFLSVSTLKGGFLTISLKSHINFYLNEKAFFMSFSKTYTGENLLIKVSLDCR